MNVIGLEVSTSAAKGILFSLVDGVRETVTVSFSPETADTVSQDPEGMTKAALEVLRQLARAADGQVEAIGLSATWHSLLLLDRARKPLGRIRTWADHSAAPTVVEFRENQEFVDWFYQRTGCMVHALYPVWRYEHLRRREPELTARAAYISSQIEYLYERLTGRHEVSQCTASGTGWFNLHTLDWDDTMLTRVRLRREQLGTLREASDAAPLAAEIASFTGLKQGIPVTTGGADGALNQIGSGAVKEGVMTFSVGTSAAIRMIYREPHLTPGRSTWCYYLTGGKWIAGAAIHACSNLEWFRSYLGGEDNLARLDQMAEEINVARAPWFLPFVYGERCPGWQEERSGGFLGLKSHHGRADLYYAVLEGILFNLYHCYRILTDGGEEPAEIRISGGITHSPLWLQLAADIFRRELSSTGVTHDSTMGAALLALKAAGGIDSLEDYHPDFPVRTTPGPAKRALCQKRFERYLELYQSFKTPKTRE